VPNNDNALASHVVATPSAAMNVIETAHALEGDLQTWSEQLLHSARRLLTSPLVNLGISRRTERGYKILAAAARDRSMLAFWEPALKRNAEAFDPFLRFSSFVSTTTSVVGEQEAPEDLHDFQQGLGVTDTLGIVALAGDTSLALGAPAPFTINLSPRDRWLLIQVALHLETGLRQRLLPGAEVARLGHDGKFLDLREPALSPQLRPGVSRHVTLVERGRGKRRRSQWEAVDAWTALVAGRWVLVEREERGIGRHYAIFEAGRGQALRALSPLEARVAELSARGLPGKSVAYALGVAPATVSKHLANAAIKLGLPNRTRVAQLVGTLLGVAPGLDAAARLTPSEREVLGLVRLGWSNQRIASARERSERTVANQVSALLHKLRAPSRRALAAVRP
jgi:DNA-binding NarL/FixJ family response regulator